MSKRSGSRQVGRAVVGLAAVALLAGCSSQLVGQSAAPATSAPAGAPPANSASPTPSQTPTPVPTSPFDGLPGGLGKTVFAVKIDNLVDARPHVGIQNADMVYVEEVEGGLTRLMAFFNTSYPKKIGPVRSARISDIDLLAPYNHIPLAYSGAQMKLYPLLWAAPLIDAGDNKAANAYSRDYSRYAPHNLFVNGQTLVADVASRNPTMAHDMGWVFSKTYPSGGVITTSVKAFWPAATVQAKWDNTVRRWVIWFDGKPEMDVAAKHAVRASTVIVQYVDQTASQFHDHWGGVTPYIHSIGTGNAIIFRNARRWNVTWSRPTASSPTTYTLNGQVFPFATGPEWILFVKKDRPVVVAPLPPTAKPSASAKPTASAKP